MHEEKDGFYSLTPPLPCAPPSLSSAQALQQTGLVPVQGYWCSVLVYIRVEL